MSRWSVVAEQETRDLWIAGRGPALMLGYAVLLSSISYLAATNRGLNFLEQREAVNLVLQVALAVGVLVTLLGAADAISGERERGTLESLLLSPAGRRSVAAGKLVAALSLWLGCVVVSIPYLWVIGRGVAAVRPALLIVLFAGTLAAVAVAGLGLVISGLATSNRVSLAVSLLVLLALFAPTQLPGTAKSWFGDLLVRVNPLGSVLEFGSRVLVGRHPWRAELDYLIAPAVLAAAVAVVMVAGGNRLVRLTGGVVGE